MTVVPVPQVAATAAMATVELSAYVDFDYLGEADFDNRLILLGHLYPLDGGSPRQDVMIPAGRDVASATAEVEAGRYLCEVELPSGQVFSTEVQAGPGDVVPVRFDLDHSPHESHSWQYLIGRVGDHDTYYATRGEEARDAPPVRWCTESFDDAGWEVPAREDLGLDRDDHAAWVVVEPEFPTEDTFIYRFTDEGPVDRSLGGNGQRRFCAVGTPDGEFLVTIPAPWFDPEAGSQRPVEMLVELEPGDGRGPVAVTVRDPRLGGGLAYFASGSFDLAKKMFEHSAEDLLFTKMSNPLAAAAGAYVLVATDDGRENPPWHQWLENLENWQSWLPDGKILSATRLLRRAETDAQRSDGKDSLLRAFEAGVPLFTVGLRWLVDGLARFTGDADVDAAIATVRQYSYRVDMTQPFVITRLGEDIW